MSAIRWIAAGLCLSFSALCLLVTAAVGVRWLRTGQTGSGLPLIGSVVGLLGVLVAPVATLSERAPYALVPLGLEALLFALGWVAGSIRTRLVDGAPDDDRSG